MWMQSTPELLNFVDEKISHLVDENTIILDRYYDPGRVVITHEHWKAKGWKTAGTELTLPHLRKKAEENIQDLNNVIAYINPDYSRYSFVLIDEGFYIASYKAAVFLHYKDTFQDSIRSFLFQQLIERRKKYRNPVDIKQYIYEKWIQPIYIDIII